LSIPTVTDPRWQLLISGSSTPAFSSLACKLALQRVRLEARQQPEALPKLVSELHQFFTKNAFAHADAARI